MTEFKLNRAGLRDLLNDADVMDEALRPHARRILDAARGAAPRATGAYVSSLEIVEGSTDRYRLSVGSPLPYASRVEAATSTLQRALDA